MRQMQWFQHDAAPAHNGERFPAVFESYIQEGVFNFEGLLHGLLGPPVLTPMEYFRWLQVKEHDYAVPLRALKDLVARLLPAVTAVDTDMLRSLWENSVGALPSALNGRVHFFNLSYLRGVHG
jgi:hypothetical protein